MTVRETSEPAPLFAANPALCGRATSPRLQATAQPGPVPPAARDWPAPPLSASHTVFAARPAFSWPDQPIDRKAPARPRFAPPRIAAEGLRGRVFAGGLAIAAMAGCLVMTAAHAGASVPLPQAGWAPSGSDVELANGAWLGFQRGGGRLEAAENACALLGSGRLAQAEGFSCDDDRVSRSLWAFYSNHETWTFQPKLALKERHCLGLRPERVVVELTGDAVSRISATCARRAS